VVIGADDARGVTASPRRRGCPPPELAAEVYREAPGVLEVRVSGGRGRGRRNELVAEAALARERLEEILVDELGHRSP
jgi:hypothetical protein